MKRCILVTTLLFLALPSSSFPKDKSRESFERFDWNNISIQLPFPKKWAVQKPRKAPHDPLNFMNPGAPPPRIIGNLSATKFKLDPKDFSVFKEEFLKSKKAWVEKSQGTITEYPVVSFSEKDNIFRYEFSFSVSQGNFKEFGHFQRCSPKVAFSLRVMIPEQQFKKTNHETVKIIEFFRNHSACIH